MKKFSKNNLLLIQFFVFQKMGYKNHPGWSSIKTLSAFGAAGVLKRRRDKWERN